MFFQVGHIEHGEQPADALKRELMEETGREVIRLDFVRVVYNDFEKHGEHIQEEMYVYRVHLLPVLQENPPQSSEDHLECAWCPLAELDRWRILPPVVKPLIVLVAGV